MEEQVTQTADEDLFERRIAKLDELAAELKQLEQSLASGSDSQHPDKDSSTRRRAN